MNKKATIKKVDDASWLVIDQHRGNVGVLYQNIQGDYEYLASDIKEKFKSDKISDCTVVSSRTLICNSFSGEFQGPFSPSLSLE